MSSTKRDFKLPYINETEDPHSTDGQVFYLSRDYYEIHFHLIKFISRFAAIFDTQITAFRAIRVFNRLFMC